SVIEFILEWERRWNEGEGRMNFAELCRQSGSAARRDTSGLGATEIWVTTSRRSKNVWGPICQIGPCLLQS
ncbi:MAG: hypothetical protein AAGJ56_10985, partial [Myxococcota bacterium]